jgi:hypothetical protein
MEAAEPVAALRRAGGSLRTAPLLDRIRERVNTTPGRLGLIAVLVVAGAVSLGAIATAAERSRADAAQAVRTQTEPLLVQASTLYTALADANATATTTFLTGGLEPPSRRARYLSDLRVASDALTTLTREIRGSADGSAAVRTIGEQLPVYSGLIESARANNLQGFPVGAAYLRAASTTTLTGAIFPAAERVYAVEAAHLNDDYNTGSATAALDVLALVMALGLGLLLLAQLYLAHVTRRIINVPMLLATVVVLGVAIWSIVGLISEQNALRTAQRSGSDSVELLTATRVLLSRAQSDQSLTLVNRGSDTTDPVDFNRVIRVLAPPAGLIGEVGALADRNGTGASAGQLTTEFNAYRARASQISALLNQGLLNDAINAATSRSSTALTDSLSANLSGQIRDAQARFVNSAADATSALAGLWIAIPVLIVLAAALALVGLRKRLGEYR